MLSAHSKLVFISWAAALLCSVHSWTRHSFSFHLPWETKQWVWKALSSHYTIRALLTQILYVKFGCHKMINGAPCCLGIFGGRPINLFIIITHTFATGSKPIVHIVNSFCSFAVFRTKLNQSLLFCCRQVQHSEFANVWGLCWC